jgi:ribosome biogenesis GTPase
MFSGHAFNALLNGEPEDMTEGILNGIVTRGHGNRFIVFAEGGYYTCQMRKKVKFKTDQTTPVAVGDDVRIAVVGEGEGVIEEVHERKSVLSRPAVGRETSEHVLAANINTLIIVASIKSPRLKPGLIDRFLIAAQIGELHSAIVINKVDLEPDKGDIETAEVYRSLGYDLYLTSALTGEGLDDFGRFLGSHRSILAGHSGVGKSTILNRLIPGVNLPVHEISHATGRGRHTTSHIELFHLSDQGFVIDSPGLKVLGLWQLKKEELSDYYPEMHPFLDQCRFTRCSHLHEPDCAVREAVKQGKISNLRYQNYTQIYNSL